MKQLCSLLIGALLVMNLGACSTINAGANAPNRSAQQTQTDDLSGVWTDSVRGAGAMTIILNNHAIYLVVSDDQRKFVNTPPTKDEMAQAYSASSGASLDFRVVRPGRWTMQFINATDPSLKGMRTEYDYEWLNPERTKLQYWILDQSGARTNETGISVKIG